MFGFHKKDVIAANVSNEKKPLTNGNAKTYDQVMLKTARTHIREGNFSEVKEMVKRNEVPPSIFKDEYLRLLVTKGREPLADLLRSSNLISQKEISEIVEIAFKICTDSSVSLRFSKDFKGAMEQASIAKDISQKFGMNSDSYLKAQELYSTAEHYFKGGV